MTIAKDLKEYDVLPLLVTYQVEGERIGYARSEAERVGLSPRIALSIRSDDPRTAALYDANMNRRQRKNPMTSGEIACYWGHRKAWQMLLDEGAAFALVLEDDFQLKDPALLSAALAQLADFPAFDILQLRTHKPRGPVHSRLFDGFSIDERKFGTTGATGYLISAAGARKLLSRRRVYRPVDEDFIAPWELGLRVFHMTPEPVTEAPSLTSSLDGQRVNRPSAAKQPLHASWLKARWQLLSLAHWLRRQRT